MCRSDERIREVSGFDELDRFAEACVFDATTELRAREDRLACIDGIRSKRGMVIDRVPCPIYNDFSCVIKGKKTSLNDSSSNVGAKSARNNFT